MTSNTAYKPTAKIDDIGTVLITGGSGFVGCNFVKTLLDKGHKVHSFDLIPSPLEHENLTCFVGNICDYDAVSKACEGVDTVFHTAAIIELKGGKSVTQEYRDRSYAVNVGGTENMIKACRQHGVSRFVYTSSNSVVIGGEDITNGDETMPYTSRYNDLYTETKVAAEKFVLSQNKDGLFTCAIRPSGIWGSGDQTMFLRLFTEVIQGRVKFLIGSKKIKLDNSFVHNLIHGQILAAQHLVEGGTAPGQAYFINDGDPVNMFEFARPIVEANGVKWPKIRVSGRLIKGIMVFWEMLHFSLKFPEPPLPPLAVERIYLNNYFSIEKAHRDLGYLPLYTTEQALEKCMPYYIELFKTLQKELL